MQLRDRSAPEPSPEHVFPVRTPAKVRRVRPAAAPQLEEKLGKLRGSNSIDGPSVGIAGLESEVHRVGAELIQSRNLALFHWLAEDDDPAVRALGLWGAATVGDLSTLAKHYCDRERIEACPGGCICWNTTVGHVAQTLAVNPAWFGDERSPSLLTAEERLKLAVQTRAIDGCHAAATGQDQSSEGNAWTWAKLRALVPALPAWMVVKAMARGSIHQPPGDLIELLRDDALPAQARLAAASGLTRLGGTNAAEALEDARALLKDHEEGLIVRLRAEISLRAQVQTLGEEVSSSRLAKRQALAEDMRRLYRQSHPLLIDLPRGSFGDRSEEVARARGEYIVSLARHLSDYRSCWDSYRDTAYQLERMLTDREQLERDTLLSPADVAKVTEKVQDEVAFLDAQLACRRY
jgi:hypothetical protein